MIVACLGDVSEGMIRAFRPSRQRKGAMGDGTIAAITIYTRTHTTHTHMFLLLLNSVRARCLGTAVCQCT